MHGFCELFFFPEGLNAQFHAFLRRFILESVKFTTRCKLKVPWYFFALEIHMRPDDCQRVEEDRRGAWEQNSIPGFVLGGWDKAWSLGQQILLRLCGINAS